MSRAVETAYEKIREAILIGRFSAGDQLKETDLVELCGVSRTPVRSALNRLAAEDLVELHRNQGAKVKAWPADDIEDLFSLRTVLEGYAAARAADRISLKDMEIMEKAINDMDTVLATSRPKAQKNRDFLRLNSVVHGCIWQASGNARLQVILSRLVEQALQTRTAAGFSLERMAESHHHHQELLQALKARDGVWAESIMRSHIRAAKASLLPNSE